LPANFFSVACYGKKSEHPKIITGGVVKGRVTLLEWVKTALKLNTKFFHAVLNGTFTKFLQKDEEKK